MKRFFIIMTVVLMSCNSSRNSTTNPETINEAEINKSQPEKIPVCIQQLINKFKSEEKQNPPRQIISYTYKAHTVYYVTPPCCDFFSDLYDSTCVLLGHPDGGFTGRGEGKITDFTGTRTNEKLIWKDERK